MSYHLKFVGISKEQGYSWNEDVLDQVLSWPTADLVGSDQGRYAISVKLENGTEICLYFCQWPFVG